MRSELPRDETRAVVRHLLAGCPRCLQMTRWLWNLGERSKALDALVKEAMALAPGDADNQRRLPASHGR
jgi:hypothetical protein